MFQQLAEGIPVALGRRDGPHAFHNEQAVFRRVKVQLVGCPARNHDIVAIRKREAAVHGQQLSSPFVHENHFIGISVFVKIIAHALPGSGKDDLAVRVDEHWFAGTEVIVFWLDMETAQATVLQLLVVNGLGGHAVRVAHLNDLSRRIGMIQQRVIVAEPLCAEQFFMVQRTVWLAELRMALVGHLPERVIMHVVCWK
jgi:hypothetical protein